MLDSLIVTAAPIPLAIAVAPASRAATVVIGQPAPSDSVAVAITGDSAATTQWTVSNTAPWAHLSASAGTANGPVRWTRDLAGLTPGTYIDTIVVTAPSALGSPVRILDTLTVLAAPLPLALSLSLHSAATTVTQGGQAPADTALVTLTGDAAATVPWLATHRASWTSLVTSGGTGSGALIWQRLTAAFVPGTYVDTLTVSASGAQGSPSSIIDSIIVSPSGEGIVPDLGIDADMHGKAIFPASNLWNQPVDTAQVDPKSNLILSTIGLSVGLHPDWGSTWGIPYAVVPDNTPRVTVPFTYQSESDPGPYPIPSCPAIEGATTACGAGTGDSHLLVITQNEWKLYEIFELKANGSGWKGGSGAIFDLTHGTTRPAGWTSADAAGLPILPGLVRYDEVYGRGEIDHALRFTVQHSRSAYVAPASHSASSLTGAQYAPMGMRVRLKASFNISGYPAPMQVILRALKKYGMIVADNGSNFFVSGTDDSRWNDDIDNALKQVKVGDFEVVRMSGVVAQ